MDPSDSACSMDDTPRLLVEDSQPEPERGGEALSPVLEPPPPPPPPPRSLVCREAGEVPPADQDKAGCHIVRKPSSDYSEGSSSVSSHVPGIMQPHKETPESPVSACLLLERTPPVKNPHPWPLEEVEPVSSTQEDMFGQNSSTDWKRQVPHHPLQLILCASFSSLDKGLFPIVLQVLLEQLLMSYNQCLLFFREAQLNRRQEESPPLETVGTFQGSVPVSQDAFVLPSQPEFSHDTFLPTPSLEEGCKTGAEKGGSSEGSEAPVAATSASSAEASLAEPREDDCVLALSASQGSQGTTVEEGKTTDDAASCALEEKLCLPDGGSEQEADEETSLGEPCSDLGHEGSVPSKASLLLEGEAVPETPCEKPEEVTLLDEGLSLRLTISQAVEQAECSAVREAFPPHDPHVTGESGKLEEGPLDNPSKAGLEVQSPSRRVHPGMMLKQTASEPQPDQGSRQFQRRAGSFPGEILHVPPEPPFCILLAKERDALTPPLVGQHKKGPRHSTPIELRRRPAHCPAAVSVAMDPSDSACSMDDTPRLLVEDSQPEPERGGEALSPVLEPPPPPPPPPRSLVCREAGEVPPADQDKAGCHIVRKPSSDYSEG
ncbi:hypothetical protein E2320_013645, partial [Naja naja]